MNGLKLKAGDWVEVKSEEEILATLDSRGQLDGLPFMPSMFQYCGRRLRVYKRAHKTCDTVNDYKGRRMANAVHLEGTRCDGTGYAGCEAACLTFWKEAWLRPAAQSANASSEDFANACGNKVTRSGCTRADVFAGVIKPGDEGSADPTYVCQATQVPAATEPLPWWDVRQYFEDFFSGNIGLGRMWRGIFYMGYYNLSRAGLGLGPAMRSLYDRFQKLSGGTPYPRRVGTVPKGERTPTSTLDLQPGELVRVKSYPEILATLDQNNRNRGLYFDAEVVPYCGGTYRVLRRVNKIVNERTGKMIKVNSSVILENVFCQACYSNDRLFCPRALYQFMREVWLERVPAGAKELALVKPDKTCSQVDPC